MGRDPINLPLKCTFQIVFPLLEKFRTIGSMLAAGSVFIVRSNEESEIVVDIFFWITSLLLYGTVRGDKLSLCFTTRYGLKYTLQRHIYRVEYAFCQYTASTLLTSSDTSVEWREFR